jgi:hypothetical protein
MKIRSSVFELLLEDRRADKQTDRHEGAEGHILVANASKIV